MPAGVVVSAPVPAWPVCGRRGKVALSFVSALAGTLSEAFVLMPFFFFSSLH